MSNNQECRDCDDYKQQGHNYCRMCGYYLTKGYTPNARIAVAYSTNEKFCGFCDGPKNDCSCTKRG